MIAQELAVLRLAKVEAEVDAWERRIVRQRHRIQTSQTSGIDLELSKQILQTFEAGLHAAQQRRNRMLGSDAFGRKEP
jgi:hypothetical protein